MNFSNQPLVFVWERAPSWGPQLARYSQNLGWNVVVESSPKLPTSVPAVTVWEIVNLPENDSIESLNLVANWFASHREHGLRIPSLVLVPYDWTETVPEWLSVGATEVWCDACQIQPIAQWVHRVLMECRQ